VKLLLDTCTFLWFDIDSHKLSALARRLCSDPDNDVYLSVVSSWEITLKNMTGKLHLGEPPEQYIPRRREANRVTSLDLTEAAILQLPKLPPLHGDPFDRILICQAIVSGMPILTPDDWITRYPINTLW
jgi:PIN domain nuclease of toxin-antitoxin system